MKTKISKLGTKLAPTKEKNYHNEINESFVSKSKNSLNFQSNIETKLEPNVPIIPEKPIL